MKQRWESLLVSPLYIANDRNLKLTLVTMGIYWLTNGCPRGFVGFRHDKIWGSEQCCSILPLFCLSALISSVLTSFSSRIFSYLKKVITISPRLSAGDKAMNNKKDRVPALLQVWLEQWWAVWASNTIWHNTEVKWATMHTKGHAYVQIKK